MTRLEFSHDDQEIIRRIVSKHRENFAILNFLEKKIQEYSDKLQVAITDIEELRNEETVFLEELRSKHNLTEISIEDLQKVMDETITQKTLTHPK